MCVSVCTSKYNQFNKMAQFMGKLFHFDSFSFNFWPGPWWPPHSPLHPLPGVIIIQFSPQPDSNAQNPQLISALLYCSAPCWIVRDRLTPQDIKCWESPRLLTPSPPLVRGTPDDTPRTGALKKILSKSLPYLGNCLRECRPDDVNVPTVLEHRVGMCDIDYFSTQVLKNWCFFFS